MIRATKSASKSVFHDADADPLARNYFILFKYVDVFNDSSFILEMRQPDEDDYGFSSKTESEMYEKMVRGFVAQNDDRKYSPSKKPSAYNLSATKVS